MGVQVIDKKVGINPRAYMINYTVFISIRVKYLTDPINDRLILKLIMLDCLKKIPVF